MSIFRPMESASWCEFYAVHYSRMAMHAPDVLEYKGSAVQYSMRKLDLIRNYGIQCCAISETPQPPAMSKLTNVADLND